MTSSWGKTKRILLSVPCESRLILLLLHDGNGKEHDCQTDVHISPAGSAAAVGLLLGIKIKTIQDQNLVGE